MKKIIAVFAAAFVAAACNNGMGGGNMPSKGNGQIDRSQRTSIDAARYIDFTSKQVKASSFTKQDIMYELNGTFKIAGGNSYITIDRSDGTVTLSSDDAFFEESDGRNFYAKYSFAVKAANEDCLYLEMDNKNGAQMIMDFQSFADQAVPDLAVCVPLYGFSRNRIEVSDVMDGFIAMPSGTYWAGKK